MTTVPRRASPESRIVVRASQPLAAPARHPEEVMAKTKTFQASAAAPSVSPPQARRAPAPLLQRLINEWDLQLMIIPSIIFLIIFNYIPMWGVLTAFQEYNIAKGFFGSPWVGFEHFTTFFRSHDFGLVMRNTIAISVLKILFGFPAPIILALVLNEVRWSFFKRAVQTVSYLPHFLSWVIVSAFVFSMLSVDNGSLNILLKSLKLIDEPVNWLSTPEYFWAILISTNIWKEVGFGAIIYLAAIAGVNPSLYEAAAIDGAGRFKQMIYITLPSIAPVIVIMLILSISNILNAGFDDILLLTNRGTNGVLRDVSVVIDTYVYHVGLNNYRFSYATAVGLFKAVVSVVLLVAANRLAKRVSDTGLW
jgi:putative aldouronate transport system permease protein